MGEIDIASLIAGIAFLIIGLVLLAISFFVWPVIFYALICLGIGIAILVSLRKQDEIEQIKEKKKDIKGVRSK